MMPRPSLFEQMPDIPLRRFRTVNGLRIHFLEWGAHHAALGTRQARTLVLLHGGGQHAYTWQPVATILARRYRLIAPDLRGHGDTDWSRDGGYSLERFRDDLHGLVQLLKLDRFVLVGVSLGGMAALSYAGAHLAMLAGLVVVDIAPDVPPMGRDRTLNLLRPGQSFGSLAEVVEQVHACNPRRDKATLRQTLPRNLHQQPDGRLTWKWDPACFTFAEPRDWEGERAALWQVAARVLCPALVVHGEASDTVSRSNGEQLARVLPRGDFVTVTDAGHDVQGDEPQRLGETIARFLAAIGD